MRKIAFLSLFLSQYLSVQSFSQSEDSTQIRAIYDKALIEGDAYENLRYLCKEIGHRLSGSEGAEKAVHWGFTLMESYGLDKTWLEPVMVPKWERGEPESAILQPSGDTLDVLALGFSVGTEGIISGEIVEFSTLEALRNAPEGSLEGKIAFLNQPMNAKLIDTFNAYGGCAGGRSRGPSAAAGAGAIGFVMRSLGLRADDFPHTGMMWYEDGIEKIPAFALSTNSAYKLSEALEENPKITLQLWSHCKTLEDIESYNVVGQITGSEFPEKVIVIGGHLDSWDVGEGAHDDGTGIVQSLEVLRILKELDIKPKYTIRCVFFMNEENGARGAKAYEQFSSDRNDNHIAALETDRGGFSPRGFYMDADAVYIEYLNQWLELFEPYNIHFIKKGYGGVDIGPLKKSGTPLIGFVPDSQRYFDVHHTNNDVFENVNQRELELGAASMASLIYLIDKYGMPEKIEN